MAPRRVRTAARVALLGATLGLVRCGGAPELPNLLLVTVDTLRADRLGAWGHPAGTSPFVDRLAAGGATFETVLVPRGQTWPTLASILTSRYPVTHGVRKNGHTLEEGVQTLAEHLTVRGWTCAAFLSNGGPAGWRGFSELRDLRDLDSTVASAARGWLRANAGKRFFLWMHFFAPHQPFDPPAPYVDRFDPGYAGPIDGSTEQLRAITGQGIDLTAADLRHVLARYDGEIRWFDRLLGRVLRTVEELGLARRTVVVLTADHGEELYARHRYFSHSASIYDTVLRVPLIVSAPGSVRAGRIVRGVTEVLDVAPTALELVGEAPVAEFEGRSLAGAIRGEPLAPGTAFAELEDRVASIRTDTWRYVHNPSGFEFPLEGEPGVSFPIGRAELYSLADDPGERRDRAAELPAVADSLRRRLEAWMAAHDWEEAGARHAEKEIPEEIRRALEAMGYLN